MLAQTKWAIEKMKEAGFKRDEFSVRTQAERFTYQGQTVTEYGLAQITIWSNLERQLELVPAMVKVGLSVTMLKKKDGSYGYPIIKADDKGQLKELEI
jgi:hypothetical protein